MGKAALFVILVAVGVAAVSATDVAHGSNNAVNPGVGFSRDLRASEELADNNLIETPGFSTQEIVVSPPLSEKDLITIVFTDEWLAEKDTSEYPDRIEFSKSEDVLKYTYLDEKTGLLFYSPIAVNDTQAVASLRIPTNMYGLRVAMSHGNISFPTKYFDNYPDLSSMLSAVHVSGASVPVKTYVEPSGGAAKLSERDFSFDAYHLRFWGLPSFLDIWLSLNGIYA